MKKSLLAIVALAFCSASSAGAGTISSGGEPGAEGKTWFCTGGTPNDNWQVSAEAVTDFPVLHDLKFWRNHTLDPNQKPLIYFGQVLPVESSLNFRNGNFELSYEGNGEVSVSKAGEEYKASGEVALKIQLDSRNKGQEYMGGFSYLDPISHQNEDLHLSCKISGE